MEVARTVEEAVKASKQAAYDFGAQETEVRLVEELAEVCRDYCKEVWIEALNLAGVPATSKQRQVGNVYYPPNIHEVLADLPPPNALPLVSSKQPLITQASLPPLEIPKGPGQAGDQSQGAEVAKDKGKGKEAETKDTIPKVKDATSKARKAKTKSKEIDQPSSKQGSKEDPPPKAKAQFQDLFLFFFFVLFLWQFATIYNVPLFFCLMKRHHFLLHESLFSLQYLFVVCEVIICPLMKLKNDDVSKSEYPDFNKANSNKPLLIHMN